MSIHRGSCSVFLFFVLEILLAPILVQNLCIHATFRYSFYFFHAEISKVFILFLMMFSSLGCAFLMEDFSSNFTTTSIQNDSYEEDQQPREFYSISAIFEIEKKNGNM